MINEHLDDCKLLNMNVLVLGLGSMGKRRIRCLKALGIENIFAYDIRADRRQEGKYLGAETFDSEGEIDYSRFQAVIISLPPAAHHSAMIMCAKSRCSFFVEASVIDEGLAQISDLAKEQAIVAAPSATLLFHPAIQLIFEILRTEKLGKLSSFTYHSGQFLPDWHPYEPVAEYYVSNKLTGGAREIVPFEMSWLTRAFGFPKAVFAQVKKTIEIRGAPEIDDTYLLTLSFKSGVVGSVLVDVVSRCPVRRLLVNGDRAQLSWDWNHDYVELRTGSASPGESPELERIYYSKGQAHQGYNINICEQMYIDETAEFLRAASKQENFRNSLEMDAALLRLLACAENSSLLQKMEQLP